MGLSTRSVRIIRDAFIETNMLEEEEYNVEGTITSGEEFLSSVQISVYYSDSEDELVTSTTSSEEGKFFIPLRSGSYTLKFQKENFQEYSIDIVLDGDLSLEIELAEIASTSDTSNLCHSNDCHNFTIYMYEVDGECIVKKPETFAVDDGTVLSMDMFIDEFAGGLGVTTEGETMYITFGAMRIPFEFYYYGTNQKYNWNTPVTSDVVIEMPSMDLSLFNMISGANCPSD